MDAYADLGLKLAYAASANLTAFIEGRNLLNMQAEDFEAGPEARPGVGLGATLRFR